MCLWSVGAGPAIATAFASGCTMASAAAQAEASACPDSTQRDIGTAAGGNHSSYAVLVLKIHQCLAVFAFFFVFKVEIVFRENC